MEGFKSAVVLAVLTLIALAVTPQGALAASAAAKPQVHVSGTITDFSPHSLTIRVKAGDYRAVALTNATTYTVNGLQSSKPQWKYGEQVRVLAQRQSSGALIALRVSVGNPLNHVFFSGAITDFSAHSLTIRVARGDFKAVALTDATKYIVNGKVSSKPAWHYGQEVHVVAEREVDGSLQALVVTVGSSDQVHVAGTITDFSPHSLTIRTGVLDYRAVALPSTTKYYVDGKLVSNPTFHYGEEVRVLAHRESDGSLTALTVRLTTHPATQRTIVGVIIDFSPNSLTIRASSDNFWAVALTANTRYVVNGQPSSKPTWQYGEHVSVVAHRELDGSLNALTVTVS